MINWTKCRQRVKEILLFLSNDKMELKLLKQIAKLTENMKLRSTRLNFKGFNKI